jgi:lipopolysaccharide transport system ATP-binding protein
LKESVRVSQNGGLRLVNSEAHRNDIVATDRTAFAIEIKGASLQYPIGSYARGSLKSVLLGLLGHRDRSPKSTFVDALRDLDMHISLGERVGLIGHNGSGKSTLLRALAGIYPLAKGDITVVGRIGTLLDISLGFEPEATGRENIYYRGMTMGYSYKQMRKAEAEIVSFADLGEFIDLPIRMYSAGMCVRLGFAISTQFQPDILLVDEVFGAGDAAFARQALDRMLQMVSNAGIFVIATHDLALVEGVCQRAIWMHGGKVECDGPAAAVVAEYKRHMLGDCGT